MSAESEISGAIDAFHPALAGHFPGNPVVPGVVILSRVCAAVTRLHGVAVEALPAVKFHAPLRPGEPFSIRLARTGAGRYGFRVLSGDKLIAAGTIRAGGADA